MVGILVECDWDCSEDIRSTKFTEDFPDDFGVHKKSLPKFTKRFYMERRVGAGCVGMVTHHNPMQ